MLTDTTETHHTRWRITNIETEDHYTYLTLNSPAPNSEHKRTITIHANTIIQNYSPHDITWLYAHELKAYEGNSLTITPQP